MNSTDLNTLLLILILAAYALTRWLSLPKDPPPGSRLQQNELGQCRFTQSDSRSVIWTGEVLYTLRRSALAAAWAHHEAQKRKQRQNNWKDQ